MGNVNSQILRNVRALLTEKAMEDPLEQLEEDTGLQFPSLQIGSANGSLSHGVWVSKWLFVDCQNENVARSVLEMFEMQKTVPIDSSH